jgi:hypothetical protein
MSKPLFHRPARLALLGAAVLLAGLVAAGCVPRRQYGDFTCGARRLQLSAGYLDQAKEKLALHFRRRVDSALAEAFHASQDSVLLARATRNCPDFDEAIRRQAIDLIKTNLLFQKLVVSNMRDQDPGVVIDLYGSEYRDIFKNDIR